MKPKVDYDIILTERMENLAGVFEQKKIRFPSSVKYHQLFPQFCSLKQISLYFTGKV